MALSGVQGSNPVDPLPPPGPDLELLMLQVQSRRTELLETSMKDQLNQVKARNDVIAKLNAVVGKLTTVLNAFPPGSQPNTEVGGTPGYVGDASEYRKIGNDNIPGCRLEQEINSLLYQTGQAPFTKEGTATFNAYGRRLDDNGSLTYGPAAGQGAFYVVGGIGGNTTKAQIEAAIQNVKGAIDSQNSSQQMDMLRLQGLSNKRNEAFDLMSNFVKKMADGRSSIVGNMR